MFSINNLKVGARLGLGFGIVLVLAAVLGGFGIYSLAQSNANTEKLVNVDVKKLDLAMSIEAASRANSMRLLQYVVDADKSHMAKIKSLIETNRTATTEATEALGTLIKLPEAKAIFDKMKETYAPYRASYNRVIALVDEGKRPEATALFNAETGDLLQKYIDEVRKIVSMQHKVLEKRVGENHDHYVHQRNLIVGLLGAAILLGLVFAWRVSRSITGPLGEAVAVAGKVAAGDLSSVIEPKSKDETGMLMQALKEMNENLGRIVSQVRSGMDEISTASNQIASGNADLSQRTEEQASSLEETASSMEELASTVKQNGDNVNQANQLAAAASNVAQRGGSVVSEVVQTMSSINDSSKKIADIIGVIDGIAFQTNILALNAAVEAARAGEQGRGFAVVASEVRTLAQRSAGAAKEIKQLISDSVVEVENGTRLVGDAGRTMQEIVDSVQRVSNIMGEISSATQEQSAGIEQINEAVTQMDQVTQQNAALVEEAAAAAESMREQAVSLGAAVAVFKLHSNAAASAPVAAEAAPVAVRAAKVTRLPARKAPSAPVKSKAVTPAKTGTDGDWSEF